MVCMTTAPGGLSRCRVGAEIAVHDMDASRAFYEGVLGLVPATAEEPAGNIAYACGEARGCASSAPRTRQRPGRPRRASSSMTSRLRWTS